MRGSQSFFEGNISVAGLLVGRDVIDAINQNARPEDTIILPSVMLRDGENVFLDEMTLDDVRAAVNRPIVVVERTPAAAAAVMLSPS